MIIKNILEFEQHVKEQYPREACGVISDGVFIPVRNKHPQPKLAFILNPDDLVGIHKVDAYVHSHTDNNPYPSKEDMQSQIDQGVPFGLCLTNGEQVTKPFFWGGNVDIPPLVGRKFRWGPSGTDGGGDCYAIIKDYYKLELNIDLPEYPREYGWWNKGETMYEDFFPQAGFHEIYEHEVQRHDVILFQWLGKTPHHGAIYVGNNLMTHHLTDKLSSRDLVSRYRKFAVKYLRYNNL